MTEQTPAPERTTPSCGPCGEVFAHAAFGGRALFLAETLRDAALSAGWQQDGGTWTCTVCQAKANAPEPEPAVEAHEPPPDTDPYAQYQEVWEQIDAGADAFWLAVNPSNRAAEDRTSARIGDGYWNIAAVLAAVYYAGSAEKEQAICEGLWGMSAKYRHADPFAREVAA